MMCDIQQTSWYFCENGDIKASLVASKILSLGYLTSGAVLVTFLLLWQNAMTRITYKKMFNWV